MEYCVIIRGPLGVGKTTVAKRLASLLNAKYISIDSVLEKNNLDKTVGPHIPAENFITASQIVLPDMQKSKKIIIFDGNFYLKRQLEHITRNLNAPYHVFTLKAPLKVCIDRDGKRKRKYGKDAANAVYRLVSKFDYGTIIDTNNKTPEEVVREILSCLPKSWKNYKFFMRPKGIAGN